MARSGLALVVNPAITYGFVEQSKEVKYPGKNVFLSRTVVFVGVATKTVSTVVMYPCIMAKVRMQFKPSSSEG